MKGVFQALEKYHLTTKPQILKKVNEEPILKKDLPNKKECKNDTRRLDNN
jgi:hypothetical protein